MTAHNEHPEQQPDPRESGQTYLQFVPTVEAKVIAAAAVAWSLGMIAYGAYEATGEDAKPVFEHNIVEVVTFQELDLTSAETGVRLLTCLGLVGSLIGGHNLAQRRYAFWRADQAAKRPPGWHEEIPDPEA